MWPAIALMGIHWYSQIVKGMRKVAYMRIFKITILEWINSKFFKFYSMKDAWITGVKYSKNCIFNNSYL